MNVNKECETALIDWQRDRVPLHRIFQTSMQSSEEGQGAFEGERDLSQAYDHLRPRGNCKQLCVKLIESPT